MISSTEPLLSANSPCACQSVAEGKRNRPNRMSTQVQIPMKPAAISVRPLAHATFGTLQRKCACGGSGRAHGECDSCKKKKLQRSTAGREAAPPIVHHVKRSLGQPLHAQTRPFMQPRPGHDFGRIRVSAAPGSFFRLPEFGYIQPLYQGNAGETGCDVSNGTPQAELHSPSLCYRDCTARHEALHVTDLTPCCKSANQAYKAAPTDEKKTAVQEKMNKWSLANRDYLECRAYGESVRCAKEFLAAHCGAPKSAANDGPSSNTEAPATTANNQSQASRQDQQSPQMLASEKMPEATALDKDPSAPPPNPEICCSTVKEYARVQGLRRDNLCSTAGKGLTNCPF